jgi:molybdopterin molybdotransferase
VDGEAVIINQIPQAGANIRRAGEDIRRGAQVLAAGTCMSPQAMGLAASVGIATLPVWRQLRVALFSTGSELAMPGEPLKSGGIYNSNRFQLLGLLAQTGCVVTDLGIVEDSLAATRAALRRAAEGHDLILTTGGVSVGEEDHVKPAVQAEGQLDLWQIAIKPGKPLAWGRVGDAAFIGLPGNPVACFVTFLMLVRPLLHKCQGRVAPPPRALDLVAAFDWPKADARREFLRARRDEHGAVTIYPNQSSGVLTSTHWADGLIDNPPGQTIRVGDAVRFLPFSELLA